MNLGEVPPSKQARRSKFQILWDCFCLKGTLIQPKTVAGVSSCDTKGPWKVWGKTDTWFPIQPKKNSANFVEAGKKGRKFKFYGFFLSKRYIGSTKTVVGLETCDTEGPKFEGKLTPGFQFSPKKIGWNFVEQARRSNFQISSVGFV